MKDTRMTGQELREKLYNIIHKYNYGHDLIEQPRCGVTTNDQTLFDMLWPVLESLVDDDMVKDVILAQTCEGCPEQYDAYLGKERVGYLRLRHGTFRVMCPDVNGETIYSVNTKGDGVFEEYEREPELLNAKRAIVAWKRRMSEEEKNSSHC